VSSELASLTLSISIIIGYGALAALFLVPMSPILLRSLACGNPSLLEFKATIEIGSVGGFCHNVFADSHDTMISLALGDAHRREVCAEQGRQGVANPPAKLSSHGLGCFIWPPVAWMTALVYLEVR
jgi:hypothetical protein